MRNLLLFSFAIFASVTLSAGRTHTLTAQLARPFAYSVVSDTLGYYHFFTVPWQIPVTAGKATGGNATFKFRHASLGLVTIVYKSAANGSDYVYHYADKAVKPGEKYVTDYFYLKVNSGDPASNIVQASLTLGWSYIPKTDIRVPFPRLKKRSANYRTGPEQICQNAVPLCGNVMGSIDAYEGPGWGEIDPNSSCLLSGDFNGVWYSFSPTSNGNLNFTISPVNPQDDYDWAVYDLTNSGCEGIVNGSVPEISCSFDENVSFNGRTGPNGNIGRPFTAPVPVTAGNTYLIFVSFFNEGIILDGTGDPASVNHGFSIDFSASTATLFTPPTVSVFSANPGICSGASARLFATADTPMERFSWSSQSASSSSNNFATGVTITVRPPETTTYTVTGTTPTGCTATARTTVQVHPNPVVSMFSVSKCYNAYSSVALVPNSDVNNVSYSFSPMSYVTFSEGNTLYVNPPVSTEYTVTATTAQGCKGTAKARVDVYPRPAVEYTVSPSPVCEGEIATITASNVAEGISLHWDQAFPVTPTTDPLVVTVKPSQNGYRYKVIARSLGGCQQESYVNVPYKLKPDVKPITGNPTVCPGKTTTLATTTTGGTWSSSNGGVATVSSTGVVTGVAAGTATITYSVTGTNGCKGYASTEVTVTEPAPGATFGNPINIGNAACGFTYTDIRNTWADCYANYTGRPGAEVVYSFTLTEPQTVTITTCNSWVGDTYLWLLNSSRTVVANNDNSTYCNNTNLAGLKRENLPAGTYYIVAEGNNSIDVGFISVNMKTEGCCYQPLQNVCQGSNYSLAASYTKDEYLGSLTIGNDGNLYVCNDRKKAIDVYSPSGDLLRSYYVSYEYNFFRSVAIDQNNNIFIATGNSPGIIRIDGATGAITNWQVINYFGFADFPYNVAVDNCGLVYATLWGGEFIFVYSNTGTFIKTIDTRRAEDWPGEYHIGGLAVDLMGNIFVNSQGIKKYNRNGQFLWYLPVGSRELAVDKSGNVYTTYYFNGNTFIEKRDGNGNLLSSHIIQNLNYDEPSGISIDGQCNIWTTLGKSLNRYSNTGLSRVDNGLKDLSSNQNTTIIYPNPSSGDFKIDFTKPGTYQLTVINAQGQEALKETTTGASYLLEENRLAAGVYTLIVHGEGIDQKVKIVKTK